MNKNEKLPDSSFCSSDLLWFLLINFCKIGSAISKILLIHISCISNPLSSQNSFPLIDEQFLCNLMFLYLRYDISLSEQISHSDSWNNSLEEWNSSERVVGANFFKSKVNGFLVESIHIKFLIFHLKYINLLIRHDHLHKWNQSLIPTNLFKSHEIKYSKTIFYCDYISCS